jgi:hypothetical protein
MHFPAPSTLQAKRLNRGGKPLRHPKKLVVPASDV